MKNFLTCAAISAVLLSGCSFTKSGIIQVNDKVITSDNYSFAMPASSAAIRVYTALEDKDGYIVDGDIQAKLVEENALLKHRLEVANEFIESRQEVLIPENYEDLKYILNECDLESTW